MRVVDWKTMSSPEKSEGASGYGLTTASILYFLPDQPSLLQTFVWQFYDIAPDHPRLSKFLDFWRAEIEGRIHSVEIAHKKLVTPAEIRIARCEMRLH